MKTHVQKWGNSLALRIPKPFAEEAGLKQETAVEVSFVEGELIIRPIPRPKISLRKLLSQVTGKNLHHEVETGSPIGRESW